MIRTVRAVVFDLDGTLVDSRGDIVGAVRFCMEHHDAPVQSDDEIAGYVGDGARHLLSRVFRLDLGDPSLDGILTAFLRYYEAHAADHTTLYPGTNAALDALAGLPLALCTNKPRGPTERVLDILKLARRFRVVVAGGDSSANKPDPSALFHIARELDVPVARIAMVGDGVQDVRCGHAAGARTVAVLGGFGSEADLRAAQPDVVIGSIAELPDAVLSLPEMTTRVSP